MIRAREGEEESAIGDHARLRELERLATTGEGTGTDMRLRYLHLPRCGPLTDTAVVFGREDLITKP